MTHFKTALFTVAAVVSTFASTLQAQRPVFVSNGNANWSSAGISSTSYYPNNTGNPFKRVNIGGDSIRTLSSTSGGTTSNTRFRPRVFIILPGDTINLTNDVNNMDTLYIYGVLNMGSGSDDIGFYSYSSGNTNTISGSSNYSSTRARRGVVFLMTNGKITNGNSGTDFQNMGTDIDGPYNLTGPKTASFNTSSSNAATRFQTFVPSFLPLPVDLASFNVNTNDFGHEVCWTAIGESNRNNFVLEISFNGTDYTEVADIAGNVEANTQNYSFTLDRQDRNFFIRLSEKNMTGYVNVLATKFVQFGNVEVAQCNVFPTVLSSSQALNMAFSEINSYQVQILNYNGAAFVNNSIETHTENEIISTDLSHLPVGQYIVKIAGPAGFSKTEKIIITD